MTKYKFWSIMLTVTMAVAIVFVSCSPTNIASDEDTVQVYFGSLQAKAIDETAYTASGSTTFGTSNVQVGDTAAYYWTYAAVKADDYFTNGKTYDKGGTPVFVNCAEGTGLGSARTFSKGAWTFTLRAYASATDRTAGTQYIFEGSVTTASMTTSQAVAIPVSYSYVEGTGTASFTITTSIEQPEVDGVTTTYKVTKVEAVIGDTTKELTTSNDGATWTGTQSIASGIQTVGINVYVDNEDTARASNKSLGTAIILHGLTNEITGSAKVTLTGADLSVSFTSSTPNTQPDEDAVKKATEKILAPSSVKTGGTLELGTYPASVSASYAGKAVTWKVLNVDTKNNRALVISEKVLKTMAHSSTGADYSWATSEIKTYLNRSFLTEYSLDTVSMVTVDSSVGNVFILSSEEANNTSYFANNSARIANDLSGAASDWWLRSSITSKAKYAGTVSTAGAITTNGDYVTFEYGVRPAFWIEMESGGGQLR